MFELTMKQKIANLQEAGCTEDEICSALKITHLRYRQSTDLCSDRLTLNGRKEIHELTRHQYTIKELVKLYKCVRTEVLVSMSDKWRKGYDASHTDVINMLNDGLEMDEVRAITKMRKDKLDAIFKDLGFIKTPRTIDHAQVLESIDEGLQFKDVAERHGISASTVTIIARRHNRRPPNARKQFNDQRDDWPKILKEVKRTGSVSQVAEKYGVSRSTIYYHMGK